MESLYVLISSAGGGHRIYNASSVFDAALLLINRVFSWSITIYGFSVSGLGIFGYSILIGLFIWVLEVLLD